MTADFQKTPFELAYAPEPRRKAYNILLVVVDDLRADHLKAYGYSRDTAPCLERRLPSGTTFKSCYSPVGWTLPGCASIVTGQGPDEHGLVDHNRKFQKPKLGHYLGTGYHRLGITNNGNVVTDSITAATIESLGFTRRPAKWKFFGWDSGFDRYLWTHRENHFRPFDLAAEFLEGLPASSEEKPWFLFFHTNIVHDYHMDREYYRAATSWLGEELHPSLLSVRDGPDVWRSPPVGLSHAAVKRQMMAKYDAGIRFADTKVEELLRRVNFDETIVILTSDHGEGFEPECGRVHHCGRLHGDLTHVPLVIWLPPELRARYEPPSVETRFASTIDIVPTLLTLLGDAVAGFPGQFLLDLPTHRRLLGCDRGYIYWNEDCVRESYDTCHVEIRSELTYPLKRITARKNDALKEYAYNLAYDPHEKENLLELPARAIARFEPVTFVAAVNNFDELRHNLLASPVARSRDHEWILVDNRDNRRHESISRLYNEALEKARNDLVFFLHQDVFLSEGWEAKLFSALGDLEAREPRWGILGAVGALPPIPGSPKQLRGHWCDPSGYYRLGPLPHEVDSLDEQWLGIRRSRGVRFDPELPGFHCYGIDLSLSARESGLKSYALDAFVWHKYRDSSGYIVGRREDSPKIRRRWSDEFMEEFQPSADHVERKWRKFLPFQTTSWTWGC
ncbi:MAG TPA: sulfatase-like hydrolase/transferase [Planctomycetota bacterium]|nr:sulfatase-like hydrolase/transferase [Planctomycetota bacterium]